MMDAMARISRRTGWLGVVALAVAAAFLVARGRFFAGPESGPTTDDADGASDGHRGSATLAAGPKALGPGAGSSGAAVGSGSESAGVADPAAPTRGMAIVGHVVDERRIGV